MAWSDLAIRPSPKAEIEVERNPVDGCIHVDVVDGDSHMTLLLDAPLANELAGALLAATLPGVPV